MSTAMCPTLRPGRTLARRPFCFVTFNRLEDAQRALAESPMNICGIPIKQLNLVEDRADYYKHRHNGACACGAAGNGSGS